MKNNIRDDIMRERGIEGALIYKRNGEQIEVDEEELQLFLSIKLQRISKYFQMLIERQWGREEKEDLEDYEIVTELQIGKDLVDGIEKEIFQVTDYISDKIGMPTFTISSRYQPTVVLPDELIDAGISLGCLNSHFPGILEEPLPKVVEIRGDGSGKTSFAKMLQQHCDWLSIPCQTVCTVNDDVVKRLSDLSDFGGFIFVDTGDEGAPLPAGIVPWQVIDFRDGRPIRTQ